MQERATKHRLHAKRHAIYVDFYLVLVAFSSSIYMSRFIFSAET